MKKLFKQFIWIIILILNNIPFCICATFFDISRMISKRHFSHFDTSVHSDARYGRRSFSPVSASFDALQRASVVLIKENQHKINKIIPSISDSRLF